MDISNFDPPEMDIPLDDDLGDADLSMDVQLASDSPPVVEIENEFTASDAVTPNLLEPGPFATESIPALGPDQTFTELERSTIDEIGFNSGCHSCGTTDPGTKNEHFVPDHQPPSALNDDNQPQELFPQ